MALNADQVNKGAQSPSFFSFNSMPQNTQKTSFWQVIPYKDREWFIDRGKLEETSKIVGRNTTTTSTVGTVFIVAISRVAKTKIPFFNKVGDFWKYLLAAGSLVVLIRTYRHSYYVDRPIVTCEVEKSMDKAQQVIHCFVKSYLDTVHNVEAIRCSLSGQFMMFPVKAHCGSPNAHVFEYAFLLDRLKNNGTCSLCGKQIEIKDLDRCKDTENNVRKVVGHILKKMEDILRCIPGRYNGLSYLPHFSHKSWIAELAKMIKSRSFFQRDVETIAENCKNYTLLKQDEVYVLSYFIVHQIKPIKEGIDRAYALSAERLMGLRKDDKIQQEVFDSKSSLLKTWYSELNIIPLECNVIRKLYNV